jgi:hypothetical protein
MRLVYVHAWPAGRLGAIVTLEHLQVMDERGDDDVLVAIRVEVGDQGSRIDARRGLREPFELQILGALLAAALVVPAARIRRSARMKQIFDTIFPWVALRAR